MRFQNSARSLASLRIGERAEIREILFDSVRDHCAVAGVHEGTTVVGRGLRDDELAIETSAGRIVCIDRLLARFVRLAALNGALHGLA